jgi:hypothetical protein
VTECERLKCTFVHVGVYALAVLWCRVTQRLIREKASGGSAVRDFRTHVCVACFRPTSECTYTLLPVRPFKKQSTVNTRKARKCKHNNNGDSIKKAMQSDRSWETKKGRVLLGLQKQSNVVDCCSSIFCRIFQSRSVDAAKETVTLCNRQVVWEPFFLNVLLLLLLLLLLLALLASAFSDVFLCVGSASLVRRLFLVYCLFRFFLFIARRKVWICDAVSSSLSRARQKATESVCKMRMMIVMRRNINVFANKGHRQ